MFFSFITAFSETIIHAVFVTDLEAEFPPFSRTNTNTDLGPYRGTFIESNSFSKSFSNLFTFIDTVIIPNDSTDHDTFLSSNFASIVFANFISICETHVATIIIAELCTYRRSKQ